MTCEKQPGQPVEGQQPFGGSKNAPQPVEPQTTHGPPIVTHEVWAAPGGRDLGTGGIERHITTLGASTEPLSGWSGSCSGWVYTPEGDFLGYSGIIDENGRFVGREWIEFRGIDLLTRTGRTQSVDDRLPRPRWPELHLTEEDRRLLQSLHDWVDDQTTSADSLSPAEEVRLDEIVHEAYRTRMNQRRVIRRRLKSIMGKQAFVRGRRRGMFDDLYRR